MMAARLAANTRRLRGGLPSFSALQASWGSPKGQLGLSRPEHNAKVGGAKNSQHTHGNAFDIDVSGLSKEQRVDMIKKARAAGFRGVGVYDNSLHFDVGGDRAWGRPIIVTAFPHGRPKRSHHPSDRRQRSRRSLVPLSARLAGD